MRISDWSSDVCSSDLVFGKNERQVIERLKAGESREELASLGTAAVIDVSFEVAKGETFVVMGLSGSGKSTLIRMITGLWSPSEGSEERCEGKECVSTCRPRG